MPYDSLWSEVLSSPGSGHRNQGVGWSRIPSACGPKPGDGVVVVAIGYVRVSTEGQAEDGVSLAAQRAKIEAWAKLHDEAELLVFEDAGLSGSSLTQRVGLQEALRAACERKGTLVVYSLSRLARSTRDTLTISDRLAKAGAGPTAAPAGWREIVA